MNDEWTDEDAVEVEPITTAWHVTSAVNRASIQEYGLDWRAMGATCGIAGATEPEMAAVFLCETIGETDFFIGFRRHPRFDLWRVDVSGLVTEPGRVAGSSIPSRSHPTDYNSCRKTFRLRRLQTLCGDAQQAVSDARVVLKTHPPFPAASD